MYAGLYTNEQYLWRAVLWLAVLDYESYPTESIIYRNAEAWLFRPGDHIGSFEWTCAILGVNAEAVRDLLRRQRRCVGFKRRGQIRASGYLKN
jgi:hypothetical protein